MSLKLNDAETIVDEEKFVKSHTEMIEFNKGTDFIKPYVDRLETYWKLKNAANKTDQEIKPKTV